MMRIVEGLLDYGTPWALPRVFLFTGNPIRRQDGALVMGRGAARVVRDLYPEVQYKIKTNHPVTFTPVAPLFPNQLIGWFQVKHHWQDPADLELIEKSSKYLAGVAIAQPNLEFHMNFPGIGNGRLDVKDVMPAVECLPDNVWLYV